MDTYIILLAYTSIPVIASVAGALLAEYIDMSKHTLHLLLHGVAGTILAVIAIEIMPFALSQLPTIYVLLAFIAGGLFFIGTDYVTNLVTDILLDGSKSGPWLLFAGVAIDLTTDGLMLGAGSTINLSLVLLLAIGLAVADTPEAFATIATLKRKSASRKIRIFAAISFGVLIILGMTGGYFILRGQPQWVSVVVLAFTAGFLSTLVVEEISPRAEVDADARWAALIFLVGFSIFTLLTTYLG